MKTRIITAMVIIMAMVACALGPAPQQTEPGYVAVRPAQAWQVCATVDPAKHRGTPHHHAVFFFDAIGPVAPGDFLQVEVANQVVVYDDLSQTATFGFPGGLGTHTITVRWLAADGREKAVSRTSVSVFLCEAR